LRSIKTGYRRFVGLKRSDMIANGGVMDQDFRRKGRVHPAAEYAATGSLVNGASATVSDS
jgi:hypothetical protein